MPGQIAFEIVFTSGFHRGSGLSVPGGVDAAIDRDAKGWPRILGPTVKGQARDGARRAMQWLGEPVPDQHDLFMEVFGGSSADEESLAKGWARNIASTTEGNFDFLPAVVPVRGDPGSAPLTDRRFHNRVDARLGKTMTDFYFSRELGSPQLILVGRVTWDHAASEDQLGLLALGLRMIETFGGKRNRGEGACLLRFIGRYGEHWDVRRDAPPVAAESGDALIARAARFAVDFVPGQGGAS